MTRHSKLPLHASLAALVALSAAVPLARADIYQWEYIDPANPGLGKQESATLAPDGAGVNATRAVDLSNRNLTKAYLINANLSGFVNSYDGSSVNGANLSGANLSQADLSYANLGGGYEIVWFQDYSDWVYFTGANLAGANLTQANLLNANLSSTSLAGAVLNGAEVRGVDFAHSGISPAQLSSTASYLS